MNKVRNIPLGSQASARFRGTEKGLSRLTIALLIVGAFGAGYYTTPLIQALMGN